jgi:hypothetical protein
MGSGMNTEYGSMIGKQAIRKPLLAILLVLLPFAAGAQEVGKIKYARGAVTLQKADGSDARLAGAGDLILQGEVIKTGPKSFAIINLQDDTRMTLRPKTTFSVEQMNAQKDDKASALLRLFRGGLRTVTGFISKFNPGGYRVKTAVATIGIRGTEFDTRLCEQEECADENKAIEKKQEKNIDQTVARAVFIRGGLSAKSYAGGTRDLKSGDAIFEGDTLVTGDSGYAILVFRDRSRVSLQANTEFRVDELKFDEKKQESHSALFSLLKGGLRTVTGLIGKLSPQKYQMRTAVATIGIRGTGYDLLCTGPCASGGKPSAPAKGEGLWASVWDGMITIGNRDLYANQAGFVRDRATPAVLLPEVPRFFQQNPVPRPTDFKVDESKLFVSARTQKVDPGLYVSVTSGKVSVAALGSGESKTIGENQALFTDASGRTVSEVPVPAFQQFDNIPRPNAPNVDTLELGTGVLGDTGGKELICEIK